MFREKFNVSGIGNISATVKRTYASWLVHEGSGSVYAQLDKDNLYIIVEENFSNTTIYQHDYPINASDNLDNIIANASNDLINLFYYVNEEYLDTVTVAVRLMFRMY